LGLNWFQQTWANWMGIPQTIDPSTWVNPDGTNGTFILDPDSNFGLFDRNKLKLVFSNPAVLKVFKLQCDMFSLGKVYVYSNSKPKNTDPILRLFKNPQPFQQQSQYLWDYMFWKMLGNAYLYVDSDSAYSTTNKMYWLDPSKIEFPADLLKYKDKLILSDSSLTAINNTPINYKYSDGTHQQIKWGRITYISDLTNGIGNWFQGGSTIDALYGIVINSRESIKSKNINARYAGKYVVAGQADPNDVNKLPMGEDEKQTIEQRVNGPKSVHAVKSMVDIKRFVESAQIIGQLDAAYWDDYFKIGSLYNIPRDVLEASLKGATWDNQEFARASYVDYTLQPAANLLTNALEVRWGYTDKDIVIAWDHLPFTQVFAAKKAATAKLNSEALLNYMKAGVKVEEINSILDTEFTELDYESAKTATINQGTGGTSAASDEQSGNQNAN
jgi:hypothetical protein